MRLGGDTVVSVGLAAIDDAWRSGFERHVA
jgi:hypothetical protein